MAEDANPSEEPKSSKKLLFIIIGAVLLIVIAVGATLFVTGYFDSGEEPVAETAEMEEVEEVPKEDDSEPGKDPLYHNLEPPFTVTFQKSKEAKLLQMSVTVLSHKEKVIEAIEKHNPMLRNNLLLLLSGQDPALLKQREGKEALRSSMLEVFQKTVSETENLKGVDQVFFTAFVMQ